MLKKSMKKEPGGKLKVKNIDIFCEIIDNFGDIGVVYRLAKELKLRYGAEVEIRVILNRLEEFLAMAQEASDVPHQKFKDITYATYEYVSENIKSFKTADVIIEAFGCKIPEEYLEIAYKESSLLINLEYLSAEGWVEDFHLNESMLGAPKLKKFFFMPGFTERSGGIIIDTPFEKTIKRVRENKDFYLKKYLEKSGIENLDKKLIGTVFSYEKDFESLLAALNDLERETVLIIMGEKSQNSFRKILGNSNKYGKIETYFIEFLNQEEYEEVVSFADFNFVRGEDSFARAVLLGKPFLWHIYIQENEAHFDKLEAFIERYRETLEGNNNEILEIHCKALRNYISKEETYIDFFKNLDKIEELNNLYSKYLLSNCSLIEKLCDFIETY